MDIVILILSLFLIVSGFMLFLHLKHMSKDVLLTKEERFLIRWIGRLIFFICFLPLIHFYYTYIDKDKIIVGPLMENMPEKSDNKNEKQEKLDLDDSKFYDLSEDKTKHKELIERFENE